MSGFRLPLLIPFRPLVRSHHQARLTVTPSARRKKRRGVIYFAYGSNMSTTVMADRCPRALPIGPARLDDHRLDFRLPSRRWGGFAADLVADEGAALWGVLWELASEDLSELDRFEASYDRYTVLPVNGGPVAAMTYRVKSELVETAGGLPHPEYLAHLIAGAREHGLPAGYVEHLAAYSM